MCDYYIFVMCDNYIFECYRGLGQVEVNTVDGFQGREKHIIILSCVRARSSTGGIGLVCLLLDYHYIFTWMFILGF